MSFSGIINWIIPAEIWNHAVRALMRSRPRNGIYCLLLELPDGTLISAAPEASWQHPWFTIPRWTGQFWEATVKPGFVNEDTPMVPGAGKDGESVDLINWPSIQLRNMRAVPSEGDPIPPFFKALGALDQSESISVDEIGNIHIAAPAVPDKPPRALWACDFYLAVARATYVSQVAAVDVSGASGQVVDYSVSYNTANLDLRGSRPRLMQAALYPPVRTPTFLERLQGVYQDDGEDRTLVSTVYFLSPPDKTAGPPDQTWTPFVRHNQYWNLMHAGRNLPPAKTPQPIRFFSGLAAGLGDIIVNQNLALDNALMQQIFGAYLTTTNEGKFWSA